MKKRSLLMILALALSLTLAIGGTLAYLQDTDADVNVMTLGSVHIVQNEQERNEDGDLVAFKPNKPAFPAVGPITWADETITFGDSEFKVFTDDLKNVVDKFVTVTNTGKSDAYVRTIIAIEAPDYDPNNLIHVNVNNTNGVSNTSWAPVVIDTVQYVYSVFTYDEALAAGETSLPSLMQLFLDSETTNEDVAKFGDTWEVLVLSQAMQTEGFKDAETALNTGFGEATKEHVAEWFGDWEAWEEGKEIGSPNGKLPEGNIDNNPPVIMPTTSWANNAETDWYDADKTEYTLNTAAELAGFAKLVNEGNSFSNKTVKLGADIDLKENLWEPIGQTGSTTFLGDFDGAGKTISNLFIDSEDQIGAHYASGLFGWLEYHNSADAINIANVVVKNAVVKGHHNVGVIAGYATGGSTSKVNVTNCSVWGAEVLCTYANADADGDKAGVIIGNATAEGTFVTGCKAEQSTVSAGRDAGQIVGAGAVADVTDCTVKNVEVTNNGTGSGENIKNEAVGRPL